MQPFERVRGINIGGYCADPTDLAERYSETVYKIAVLQTRNTHDAEDILQEVFLRLVKYRDRIQSEEHAKAWLIRVTQTCSHKLYGSAWKRRTTSMEDNSAAVTADMNHEQIELYETLTKLSADARLTLHLHYHLGYSVAEIAVILEISPGSVKSRLSRARKSLREKIGRDI